MRSAQSAPVRDTPKLCWAGQSIMVNATPDGAAAAAAGKPLGTFHSRKSLTGRTGNYGYMAPEVTRCQPYNAKVDVFSLGMCM